LFTITKLGVYEISDTSEPGTKVTINLAAKSANKPPDEKWNLLDA